MKKSVNSSYLSTIRLVEMVRYKVEIGTYIHSYQKSNVGNPEMRQYQKSNRKYLNMKNLEQYTARYRFGKW